MQNSLENEWKEVVCRVNDILLRAHFGETLGPGNSGNKFNSEKLLQDFTAVAMSWLRNSGPVDYLLGRNEALNRLTNFFREAVLDGDYELGEIGFALLKAAAVEPSSQNPTTFDWAYAYYKALMRGYQAYPPHRGDIIQLYKENHNLRDSLNDDSLVRSLRRFLKEHGLKVTNRKSGPKPK